MENIRHIGIVVSNLEEALKFYRDLLGLKVISKIHDEKDEHQTLGRDALNDLLAYEDSKFKAIKLTADDKATRIELIEFSCPKSVQNKKTGLFNQGFTHVCLTVNDIDELYGRLKKAGVQFNCPPKLSKTGMLKLAICKDFEGNYLELTQEI